MKLYRGFATVGAMTVISRVLGFVRDVGIAAVLGTSYAADAFFVAFRVPNMFRRLFAEGAFDAAFIPLFAKRFHADGAEAARAFAGQALTGLTLLLMVVVVLAEIAMPWLMLLLAPGFRSDPAKFDLAVLLARIALPYLVCMALVALYTGMLNALGRFALAAFAPSLLNVVLIAALLAMIAAGVEVKGTAAITLAWAVAVSGVLQVLLVIFAAARSGMGIEFQRPRLTPEMKRLLQLAAPGLLAGGMAQITLVIGTIIATLQDRVVSWLYYADRIFQLPLGVIGVAIGVVLLPDLSHKLRAGDHQAVASSENRALQVALLLTVPAATALYIAALPIIRVLFQRGAFAATDTEATAAMLSALALGLPAYVLIKVLHPSFFAREDTKTPMIYAAVSLIANTAGSVALFFLFRAYGLMPHLGIAVATTLGGWLNAGLLYATLVRRGYFVADQRLMRTLPRILLASLVMGAVLWVVEGALSGSFGASASALLRIGALIGLVGSGLVVYVLAVFATGAMDMRQLRSFMQRRTPPTPI
jgi:putative peptidoglycan lipid II flippase